MQPLSLLNNVQKARHLHSLLRNEIPEFLGYLNELTETVLNDRERIAAEWKETLFGVELWFEMAAEMQKVMAKYPKDLHKSSPVFGDQLFGGFMAMFTVYALQRFVAANRYNDPKFKPAVELLFS